ncbi:V-type proton ATPase subunit e 1-like [Dermacentor silvarum]|uniref:V-type proton ATPase subunit e 1-like n=1 Tax=Dermacentor silvarum TaxID=543639 RepID=UPI002100D305|nr:V-type proton ATPase subunit e 1-like [Dermacentor silvarum]
MPMDERLVASMSAFWLGVAVLSPCFVPRSENRGVIRCMLVCTAACLYLSWLCTYLAQINPLIGPALPKPALLLLDRYWTPTDNQSATTMTPSAGQH